MEEFSEENLALSNNQSVGQFDDTEMNQEVRDMIKLGLLDRNWAQGLNKTQAEIKFNQILSDPSLQQKQTEPFEEKEMNQEVRDMIKLGLLDRNWAQGLNKTQAEIKFNQILSDPSLQQKQTEPFEEKEMNQEVRDMIKLGLLDRNWAQGLNKTQAEIKFNQILSDPSLQQKQTEPFEEKEMNQEVRDMIKLGLLDRNWAQGLNKTQAEIKFNQILSDPSLQQKQTEPFEEKEMNQEVRDMIKLGLLDRNWAQGLNKTQAEIKFNQILSDPSLQQKQTEPFEEKEMNQEVRDMIKLGLLDRNWAQGLNKKEAEIKINQILSDPSLQQKQTEPYEDEDMNQEVRDMINLGLLDRNLPEGLNKKEAEIKLKERAELPRCLPSGSRAQNSQSSDMKGNNVSKKNYKLIPLSPFDDIFKAISEDFERCGFKRKIEAIQRVENEKREKLFENEMSQLAKLHGNDSTSELHLKDLYHASNAPRNLLCSRGLDHRLGQVGVFGRGIYFSDDIRKCEKYLLNTKGCAIYRCSVILGDIMEYPDHEPHPELKQEPEKENGDYYDSVKGNVDGFNEYVVYDNRRCLIKYRIVLEGIEDEDIDFKQISEIEDRKEKEEEMFDTWKRHMHYLVDTCRHEDNEDEDKELEIRCIEKIRLEIRRRRELQGDLPLTQVSYNLVREERKFWKKCVKKGTANSKMPPQQEPDIEELKTDRPTIPDVPVTTEDDSIQLVFDVIMSKFIEITACEDVQLAKEIIENQEWNLDSAVNEYFSMM